MKRPARITVGALVIATAIVGVSGAALAESDPTFQCVSVNLDTCTVTIPLTSNVNEQVGSTMPDNSPWYMEGANGQGPYGLTGPGNPQTSWNGVGGALQGTVWTAVLTTGADEPAGSEAVLTFEHVNESTTTTGPGQPYSSISESYPLAESHGATTTVTATVRPVPAKGHLVLLRKNGAAWVRVGALTYAATTKRWTIRFKWTYPARKPQVFRLLATAAPGLLATYGGTFKIA